MAHVVYGMTEQEYREQQARAHALEAVYGPKLCQGCRRPVALTDGLCDQCVEPSPRACDLCREVGL